MLETQGVILAPGTIRLRHCFFSEEIYLFTLTGAWFRRCGRSRLEGCSALACWA